jgi:hypothetical protein
MKLVYKFEDTAFPITLEQEEGGNRRFRVTYGLQIESRLTYSEACEKLGEALLHAAGCDGLLVD